MQDYAPDARAGVASAMITGSPVDSTYANVTIKFADGGKARMLNMIAMGGPATWRMGIGQPGEPLGQ